MHSKHQKALHKVAGKPMLQHVFEAAEQVADAPPLVVVGPGEEGARQLLGDRARYAVQRERLGTGHATLAARAALEGEASQILVTYADMPLLRVATMEMLAAEQSRSDATISMLSVRGEPESSFGRVVRDVDGHVVEIVEVAEAKLRADGEAILATRELNAGVYCFDADWLWRNLEELPVRAARSGPEYYLTDMVGIAVDQGSYVAAVMVDDPDECLGAGTRAELVAVERAFRDRVNRHWLENGVTLIEPDATYIEPDVIIGQDTVVWPNTYLQGQTVIGDDCELGPNTVIRDARVGRGSRLPQTAVDGVDVPAGTKTMPFSRWIADSQHTDKSTCDRIEEEPT
jgi:bifunctional UDP-N-acetylglucosamine pyrophosphorylase/glucosamine-1-phosphate N-acetyltransferase